MNITKTELEFYVPETLIKILISFSILLLLCHSCRVLKKKVNNIQMLNPLLKKNNKLQEIEKIEKIEEIEENVILPEDELPSYSEIYNKN